MKKQGFLKPFKSFFAETKKRQTRNVSQKKSFGCAIGGSTCLQEFKRPKPQIFLQYFFEHVKSDFRNESIPLCAPYRDRLYVVHHSFPITSSSILVRYMMTTKVSYQLVLMIFQFPKCGSCGFDGSHIFGCASNYHTSTVPYSYLVDPFFLTPTETICTSKPPFLTLGEKMRHAHFSQTSSKDSGTFFLLPLPRF